LTILACLPGADMRTTALVLVATMPLAYLGAWVEQRYRTRQNASFNKLITWNRRGIEHAYTPHRLIFWALGENVLLHAALFMLCVTPMLAGLRLIQPWLTHGLQPTWPMLWIGAVLGAILALRLRRAYALAGISLLIGVLFTL